MATFLVTISKTTDHQITSYIIGRLILTEPFPRIDDFMIM